MSWPLFAILVAGGTGTRMGSAKAKQFIVLKDKPLMIHTLDHFLAFDPQLNVVVVLHESLHAEWEKILSQFIPSDDIKRVRVCRGGQTRSDSVKNGMKMAGEWMQNLQADDAWVAVHDAVRPILSRELLKEAFDTAMEKGNAVVAVAVKSSMRKMEGDHSVAVDRSLYYHVQTPQIFSYQELNRCFEERKHSDYTDEASLAEDHGIAIHLCNGSYDNIKVTTQEDLMLAGVILS